MSTLVLICAGLLVSNPPDRAEYQAAAAWAGRDARAHVKLAVWCEAHGLDAERLEHLAAALAITPQDAAVRGMMGLVAYGGRWLPPEKAPEAVKADEALAAKRARDESRRQETPASADGQWQLGLWCEKNGLKGEAMAHFTAVTQIAPRRVEAWHKLGCQLYRGRWLNAEQPATERAEEKAQKDADRHWQPILEARRKDRVFDNPDRDAVIAALREITDPRAVPSILRAFGHGNRAQQEAAVDLLGRIDCPASSHALAAVCLFDRWPEVRTAAVQGLRRRDPRDYMGSMIGLLRHPLKYEARPVGMLGESGVLEVENDTSRTRRVHPVPEVVAPNPGGVGYVALDGPGRTTAIGPSNAWDVRRFLLESPLDQVRELASFDQRAASVVGWAARQTEQTLQRDLNAIRRYNTKVESLNGRIGSALAQIAGDRSPGTDPDAWVEWWTDKLGLKYERPEPRYEPTTVNVIPTTLVLRVHKSGFAAGTPVATLTGPRPIESLEVGDVVLSQDTATGALGYHPIVGVHRNPPSETLRLGLREETIVCTPIHRFWRPGRGWAMARDLRPGELIPTVGGRAEVVAVEPDAVQPVYNLDVARDQTFFVGRGMALVRDNSLPPSMLTPFDAEPSLASIAVRPRQERHPEPHRRSSMLGGPVPHS